MFTRANQDQPTNSETNESLIFVTIGLFFEENWSKNSRTFRFVVLEQLLLILCTILTAIEYNSDDYP